MQESYLPLTKLTGLRCLSLHQNINAYVTTFLISRGTQNLCGKINPDVNKSNKITKNVKYQQLLTCSCRSNWSDYLKKN